MEVHDPIAIGLAACLKALREGDELVIWRLDRLQVPDRRRYRHDYPHGEVRADYLRRPQPIRARADARACDGGSVRSASRGRQGGRKSAFTKAMLRRAQAAMQNRDISVEALCSELGVTKPTLYRNVTPNGELTDAGKRVLAGVSAKAARA